MNNCEYAPEVCNEFVTIYLDEPNRNQGRIKKSEIIDLTQHLCHWLFTNRLTCSKLSMVASWLTVKISNIKFMDRIQMDRKIEPRHE